jgi:O-antigen/teichoic acid export membrane protein
VAVGLACVVGAQWFGGALLARVHGAQYAAQQPVLVTLMAAATVAYAAWLLGFGMTAAQAFRPQFPVLLLAAIATWAGCRWWIPARGLEGAAEAYAGGMAVLLAGSAWVVMRAVRKRGELHR